ASVAQFYAGKSVLITGATGFMGKVLVEKLCAAARRSAPSTCWCGPKPASPRSSGSAT
ncbi:unnamed protein product, partial [Tetraodon nigroviridis]